MQYRLERTEMDPSLLARFFIGGVRLYQKLLSPLMFSRCRFVPSCSTYAIDAVSTFGIMKGIWLAVRRIGRCHPWHEGGWDPVLSSSPLPDGRTKGA